MNKKLHGRKVIVTGGNRGIGKAIALAFAEEGCDIVITYNSGQEEATRTIEAIKKFNVNATAISVNLLNAEEREKFIKKSINFLGYIDILVNNAGILTRASFLELSSNDIEKVLTVNTLVPLYLMQSVSKHMIEMQKSLASQGLPFHDCVIANVTSLSRKVITPGLAHYEISKAATSQLTRSAAMDKDLLEHHIRVVEIAPGLIPTDINRSQWQPNSDIWKKRVAGIPLGRAGTPEEIAQAVVSVAANAWMTGTTITIDGGRTQNWSGAEAIESKHSVKSKL